jgi:L-lactate utilization protein LutB
MRLLNVTSPTGGIEIYHQKSEEKANEIVGDILEKHRNRS